MIKGVHAIVFAEEPEKARAFLRDVLELPDVDAGDGWVIFALPPAELAVHPGAAGNHELYFMCDDIDKTVASLQANSVQFTAPISDERWGRMARFMIPGAGEIGLYEPRHPSPLQAFSQPLNAEG